jgi:hypothetical protein
MSSPAYYREEARRCRELAASASDATMAERWRTIAREYEQLADAMAGEHVAWHPDAGAIQAQPMQQQNAKLEKKDE